MFNRVLNEIEICLNNNATLAALALALTLPDAFGKIEFSDSKPKQRYVDWINKYASGMIFGLEEIATPIREKDGRLRREKVPSDGEMIYHVRSTLFHEGTTKMTSKGVVNYVRLLDDEPNDSGLYVHAVGATAYDEDEESLVIHYRMSIRGVIEGITSAAKRYYEDNIGKMVDYEDDWTIKSLKMPF